MKKNYILALFIALITSIGSYSQDLIITGVFDGPLSGGTPKGIELYVVSNIADLSIYGVGSANNGGGTDGEEFTFPADAATAGSFIYVTANATEFNTFFGFSANYDAGSAMGINGDDAIELFMSGNVVDVFGDINKDGSNEPWDYLDGWAYRKSGKTASTTFTVDDWTYSGVNALDGQSTNATASNPIPVGTYSAAASTTPSLTITSPSASTIASTTSVSVSISIDNFTISGDNGSGASDNSGDGFIKSTFETQGGSTENTNFFTKNLPDITVAPGNTYTLTLELVDNAGASLSTPVSKSVTFTVSLPCDIQLGSISSTCDATTPGVDTFDTTIPFTVGQTSTYTITAKDGGGNDVGTIEGDNPSNVASGNIIISNVPEGTSFTVKVIGDSANSSCDLTRNISSPTCIGLPIYDPFNYTANTDLISHPNWSDASTSSTPNNIQVKLNDDGNGNPLLGSFYTNNEQPPFTGNMVSLVGGGSDPYTGFSEVNSGKIYASFTLRVTNMDDTKSNQNGGYFAVLTEPSGSFKVRLWIKDPTAGTTNEGLNFQLGISNNSTASAVSYDRSFVANIAEPVFVVMSYNFDTDFVNLWINPDASSFGTNTPPGANANAAATGSGIANSIGRFLLRQDSTSETPAIDLDELRIGTTWSDVAPKNATASTGNNQIDGFATYPNPITNKNFTITSASSDKKEVVIYNVLGKKVFSTNFLGLRKNIKINSVDSGIYILKVTENGKTATKKLVIR